VVPGALSAVQGAEALAGVVDIRLRRPEDRLRLAGTALTDTDGGVDLAASASAPLGTGGVLIGAGHYDRFNEEQTSGLERTQVMGRLTQAVAGFDIGATGLYSDIDRTGFPEDSGGVRLALNSERQVRDGSFVLAAADIVKSDGPLRPEARFSWSRTDSDVDTPAIFPGVLDGVPALVTESRFDRYQADIGIVWDVADVVTLAAGAGYVREEGESDGTIDVGIMLPTGFDIERDRTGGYLEATFRPTAGAALTASVRIDDPEDLDTEFTARVAGRWTPVDGGPELFASYGEGYRLPSLFALAFPLIANPDLLPERSDSVEAGISQPLGARGRATITYFHTRYTDLIDFEPALFTNVNRDRVTTEGVDAKASYAAGRWTLGGTISYLDTDVPADVLPLRSRPEWQGALDIDHQWDSGLSLGASLVAVDESFDSSIATGLVTADGFVTVDVRAAFPVLDGVVIEGGVRNLFDEDYEESVGVPALGITGSIGLRLSI
ncbi:MAG: TonB-dependent receptor, partial [Pseudomonadota bacterium]